MTSLVDNELKELRQAIQSGSWNTPSKFNIGDAVLMKRTGIGKKDDSEFLNTQFKIIDIKHSMITVENDHGKRYTRNISFFKKVKAEKNTDNREEIERNQRKSYPKRNRISVQR